MESSDSQSTISEQPEASTSNMEEGKQPALLYFTYLGGSPVADMFSEDLASPGDSTSLPDTFGSNINSALLSSSTPSHATSSTTSVKTYVLTYDATIWAHDETTDKITLLDGTPITVAVNEYISAATVQPVGVLGVYFSEAKARKTGKAWLYDQLMGLGFHVHLPLPTHDGSESTEPDWRKSEWRRTADGSWGYSISDYSPRMLALIVHVTEQTAVADEDDDDDVEYRDSDDDAGRQEYVLVGPVGRRKRVAKTWSDEEEEEEEEADGEETVDTDANGDDGTIEEGEGDDLGMDMFWDQNSDEGDLEDSNVSESEMEEVAENETQEVVDD